MKENNYWLFIEPFVHIEIKKSKYLLYNTLNFSYIEGDNSLILDIVDKIAERENNRVINLGNLIFKKDIVNEFVNVIRLNYMGDYYPINNLNKKPIQYATEIKLTPETFEADVNSLDDTKKKKMLSNLKKVMVYVNSNPEDGSCFDFTYKQFLSPRNIGSGHNELDFNILVEIIDFIHESDVKIINILGGNLFKYSNFESLIYLVSKLNIAITLNFKYYDIFDSKIDVIINKLNNKKLTIKIFVDNNYEVSKLQEITNLFMKTEITVKFVFLIFNIDEYKKAKGVIKKVKNNISQIVAVYNRTNKIFFEQAISFKKEDVFNIRNDESFILKNKYINSSNYGTLIFETNGDCFTNINSNAVGNILIDPIYEIINNSLKEDSDWLLSRNKVQVCRECIYNALCPPISNYEKYLNKYNLCSIS